MSAVYYTIPCMFSMFIVGTRSLKSQSYAYDLLFDPYYIHRHEFTRYGEHHIRGKANRLMRELICDADAKVMSLQHIKKQFGQSGKYHLGQLISHIRNKHGYMIRKLIHNKRVMGLYHHEWYVKYTIRMQTMFQEIDHLVQMAVEYDQTDPSGRLFGRMGPIVDEDESIDEGNLRRSNDLKQKAYMERKKKEWAVVHGYDITNVSTRLMLRNKNKEEGGFDSDIN